mmetsp:Transcript_133084/g.332209  ORF Transcript_133084/g.332209 Transcript_133084/m.332209 type:complete len:165 (+) Transcript_133084:1659-2153(+)
MHVGHRKMLSRIVGSISVFRSLPAATATCDAAEQLPSVQSLTVDVQRSVVAVVQLMSFNFCWREARRLRGESGPLSTSTLSGQVSQCPPLICAATELVAACSVRLAASSCHLLGRYSARRRRSQEACGLHLSFRAKWTELLLLGRRGSFFCKGLAAQELPRIGP